jgi:predicted lipoprotein with Yx(FWY)xxD motif
MKRRLWAAGVLGALLLLTACGSSSSSGQPAGSGGGSAAANQVTTASTTIGTVLVNSQGRTLYWFAIDTPTSSKCGAGCASVWPPVPGPVTAASGTSLPHGFGTITRSDGTVQATYDGHPLYTYAGDTGAGQTKGNGLNANGGVWHAMTPTAAMPGPAPKTSSSSTGGGGYGY